MKVEMTERRISRGYASDGLGEQRNRYRSKAGDPRVMESSMLKSGIIQVKKVTCESMMDIHSYAIEDSKSLAQSGYAQRIEDVDALMVLIEERSA